MATPRKPSLYDLLQVRPDATTQDVRSAYRRLARRHHPDRSDSTDSEMMSELNSAYETLSDPDSRAHYDRNLFSSGRPRRRVRTLREAARARRRAWAAVLVTVSVLLAIAGWTLLRDAPKPKPPRPPGHADAKADPVPPPGGPAPAR